ncbi:hypothetical protein HPB48_001898 [Haemaphysalis longicornis]|uniref:Uncharacterized protein n=1 Tax=Haemaphysalis longicornis TaxID=44386 RepID=A0A9J6G480_HAELO|nr:hypothetical protein HPB48_001898 [Haemaphysalis longicornis]
MSLEVAPRSATAVLDGAIARPSIGGGSSTTAHSCATASSGAAVTPTATTSTRAAYAAWPAAIKNSPENPTASPVLRPRIRASRGGAHCKHASPIDAHDARLGETKRYDAGAQIT